jgi:hypothetical protein
MQSDFFKMDVFFVIASVFGVIIGILSTLILWKILKLLGKVEEAKEKMQSFLDKWKHRLKLTKK